MKDTITKPHETWHQFSSQPELWETDSGLIINTAALEEREAYFEVTRGYAHVRPGVLGEGSSAPQH